MNKVYRRSGYELGQTVQFRGVRQRRQFPVHIGSDVRGLIQQARTTHDFEKMLAVYDQDIPGIQQYVQRFKDLGVAPVVDFPLPAGEDTKDISRISEIMQQMREMDLGEKTVVLVIGGGTLCNAAGFIGATWEGMKIIFVPTNYIAIGDVAIGSLHMVNVGSAKNRLQLHHDPLAVILDPAFIDSLPHFERQVGLAETAKHAISQDLSLMQELEAAIADKSAFENDNLFDLALWTAKFKDDQMAISLTSDQTQGILLYGHTIAHAIEPATGYKISHGEAVSLGLLVEVAFFHSEDSEISREWF